MFSFIVILAVLVLGVVGEQGGEEAEGGEIKMTISGGDPPYYYDLAPIKNEGPELRIISNAEVMDAARDLLEILEKSEAEKKDVLDGIPVYTVYGEEGVEKELEAILKEILDQ